MPDHRFGEERVTVGLGVDGYRQRTARLVEVMAGGDGQQVLQPGKIETLERDSLGAVGAPQVGEHVRQRVRSIEVRVAIRADEHDRSGLVTTKEVAE